MKKMLLAVSALAALTLLAPNTGIAQLTNDQNQIGIYLTEDANGDPANVNYNGAPGQFTAYIVLTNPYNYNTSSPIVTVGGFEFKLIMPASVFLLGGVLPPESTNFASPPNYFVGTSADVVNNRVTLLTLTLGAFAGAPDYIYLAPVDDIPSVPGTISITDKPDGFSISQAFPASGDFANAVFGLFVDDVTPTENATWGDVQSLYR